VSNKVGFLFDFRFQDNQIDVFHEQGIKGKNNKHKNRRIITTKGLGYPRNIRG
jgi:hypothetical protein